MSTFTSLISRLHLAESVVGDFPMPYFMAGKKIQTSRLSAVLTVRDKNSYFYLEAPHLKKYEELLPFPEFISSKVSEYIPCYEKVAFALSSQGLWSGKTSYGVMKLMWIPLDLEEHITAPFLLMFDHKVYHFGSSKPRVCIQIRRNNIEIVRGNVHYGYNSLLRPCQDIHGPSLDDEIWEICKKFPDMSNSYVDRLLDLTPYTKYERSVRKRRAYFALRNHLMKKPHDICATKKEKMEMIRALKRLPIVGVTKDDKFKFSEPLEVEREGKMVDVPVYGTVQRLKEVEYVTEVPSVIRRLKHVDDLHLAPLDDTQVKVYSNADSKPRCSIREVSDGWDQFVSGFTHRWVVSKTTFSRKAVQFKDSRGVWMFPDRQYGYKFDQGNGPWVANTFDFKTENYISKKTAFEHKREHEHMGLIRYICSQYPYSGIPPADFFKRIRERVEESYPGFTRGGHYEETLDYSNMIKKVETKLEPMEVKIIVGSEKVFNKNEGKIIKVKPNPKWPEELVKLSYKPGFSVIRSEYFPYKKINEEYKSKWDYVLTEYTNRKTIKKKRKEISEEKQQRMKELKILEDKAIDEMIKKNAEMMFDNPDILLPDNSERLLKSLRAGGFSWRAAKRLRVAVIAMINGRDAYEMLDKIVHLKYRAIVWSRKHRIEQFMADY